MEITGKKVGELCFWIGIVTELLIVMIDKSAYINHWESQLFRITFALFCIKIITTQYSIREWVCMAVVGVLAMISYLVNEKDEIVRIVIFIAACKDISLKAMMKTSLWITAIGSAVLVFLSVTGIYGVLSLEADYGRGAPGELEVRYCFGMGHPNAFHTMMWIMVILLLFVYQERIRIYHLMILFCINIVLYMFTDSSTGLLIVSMTLIGFGVLKYVKMCTEKKFFYILGALLFGGCIIFVFAAMNAGITYEMIYTGDVWLKLDRLLNGRYQSAYAVEAARIENWKWFADAANMAYFDAGFVRIIYWYGVIPFLMYSGLNLYLIFKSYQYKDYMTLLVVVIFSVYTLMEAHFISVYIMRNYLFVLMGYYWYQPFQKYQEHAGYFWQVKRILGKA